MRTAFLVGLLSSSAAALPPLLPLPLMRQATTYSCGAAAMQSVLAYWGVYDGNEAALYGPLKTTPKDGTDPRAMAAYAKELGLKADWREGTTQADLREALKKGETVILDLQAWRDEDPTPTWADNWEDGHYVVLAGMDERFLYLMDPSLTGAYATLPLAELDDRWHDYEDRDGKMWRTQHLAIFISGKKPAASYPMPPQPML